MKISLQPQEIMDLAHEINDTIATLTNIDEILDDTHNNVEMAKNLKKRADKAK